MLYLVKFWAIPEQQPRPHFYTAMIRNMYASPSIFLKRHRPMNTNIYLKISQMHIGFSDANPLFSSMDIGIFTNH